MKRIISLCHFLCLILTVFTVFSGCAKEIKVDFTEYKVIYPVNTSEGMYDQVRAFYKGAGEKMGFNLKGSKDAAADPVEKEILIGYTNRPETNEALEKVQGDGFIVTAIDKKIVIVGTTNFLTCRALEYFAKIYLSGEGTISSQMTIKHHVENVELISLDDGYSAVYAYGLDDKIGSDYGDDYRGDAENPNGFDYPVVAARQVINDILKVTGGGMTDLSVMHDKMPTIVGTPIYIGRTVSPETAALHASFDVDTYGFSIKDGRIAVGGLNENMLRLSVAAFREMISDSMCEVDGQTVIRIPGNYTFISKKATAWRTDFPRPDGLSLSGSVDVNDNSVEFYYEGDGVSADAYRSYCQALENAGYVVYMENTIGDNLYATYVNEEAKTTLHVVYAAFSYREEQEVKLFSPCIRVITAPIDSVNLIPEEWLDGAAQTYKKVTETKITSMRLDHEGGNAGNAYIITLEDGSFIVLDGGDSKSTLDRDRLWCVLSDLYINIFHEAPSEKNPICIAAWYLSHGHGDHYGNFYKFCEKYGQSLIVESFIANLSSDAEEYNCYDPNPYVRNTLKTFSSYLQNEMVYYKVHAGQKFFIRNVEMEVLYTHEEMYPQTIELFNDVSTIIRMGFYSTDGNGVAPDAEPAETCIWLGDLHYRGSKYLRAMFGDYLKSDMVQMAHHGLEGCEWELYQLIAPTTVWWPTSGPNMYWQGNYAGQNHYCFYTDHMVFNALDSVKYIISNDGFNTTVTITADGAVYSLTGPNAIYNADDSEIEEMNELTFNHPEKYLIKFD